MGEVELGVPEVLKVEFSPAEGIGKLKSQKPGGGECWTYYDAVEAEARLTARVMMILLDVRNEGTRQHEERGKWGIEESGVGFPELERVGAGSRVQELGGSRMFYCCIGLRDSELWLLSHLLWPVFRLRFVHYSELPSPKNHLAHRI